MKNEDILPPTTTKEGIQKTPSNKTIPYSIEELEAMKSKSRFDLAHLIESQKWLDFIYTGDWEHNDKLRFVRMFYFMEWKKPKPKNAIKIVGKKQNDDPNQFKLMI